MDVEDSRTTLVSDGSPLGRVTSASTSTSTCTCTGNTKLLPCNALSLASKLQENSEGTALSLEGCLVGNEGVKAIANMLRVNSNIESLRLSDHSDNDPDEGHVELAKALEENRTLKRLIVGSHGLGFESYRAFSLLFCTNNHIADFSLSWSSMGNLGSTSFGMALPSMRSLAHLTFSHCDIGSEGAIAICLGLKENKSLEKLDLKDNLICFRAGPAFGSMLAINETLTSLFLDGNELEDEGITSLLQGLSQNRVLEELGLNRTSIGDASAISAGEIMEVNTSALRKIFLGDNLISDLGVQAIAKGLLKNERVLEIDLSDNLIKDGGARSLAKALPKSVLEALTFRGNPVTIEGANAILRGIEPNRCLTRMDIVAHPLSRNCSTYIDPSQAEAIQSAVEFFSMRNEVGWPLLQEAPSISTAMWAVKLARISLKPDLLYFLLQQKPDLCKRE
jgi:Ran GTPase-activating protein (RanGAP) involved in mRNA processing and transport